jgi:RecB family exonuclease
MKKLTDYGESEELTTEHLDQHKVDDFSRVQSPSSINTYIQCPKKYFFRYIKGLSSVATIDQLRGKLLHSILEDFFDIKPEVFSNISFLAEMKIILIERLSKRWEELQAEFDELGFNQSIRIAYFYDAQKMLINFLNTFSGKLHKNLEMMNFENAFKRLCPEREVYLKSERFKIHGYLDAVHKHDKTVILDYKTCAKDDMKDAYKNQLSIYSLMYFENFKKLPDEVGIHFLMHNIKTIPATKKMVMGAAKTISQVHKRTLSKSENDYKTKKSGLCKWHSGQCEYYDHCLGKSP